MVFFSESETKKLDLESVGALSRDLTGFKVMIWVSDEETFGRYSEPWETTHSPNPKFWSRSSTGKLYLKCRLLERVSGPFQTAEYLAVILNEGSDTILGWQFVKLDAKGEAPDSVRVFPFELFGFSNQGNSNPLETEEFEVRILDPIRGEGLNRLRTLFELEPSAQLYNKLKKDAEERASKKIELERVSVLIDEMEEWRLENREKVTELFLWKEHEFRQMANRLRFEVFGKLKYFQHLEDVWFTHFDGLHMSQIPKVEGSYSLFRQNKHVSLEELAFGEVFVQVELFNEKVNLTSLVASPAPIILYADNYNERDAFLEIAERIEFLRVGLRDQRFSPIGYFERISDGE